MTTELEKQFFDTFGIEPRKVKICRNINHCPKKYKLCDDDCKHWQVVRTDYPQITDTHYLQLICYLSSVCCPHFAFERDISELKEIILKFCIHYKDQLEKSVQVKCLGTYKTFEEAKQVRINAEKEYRPYTKEINKYGE